MKQIMVEQKEPDNTSADCYSAGDRGLMLWSQQWRSRLLKPLLILLVYLHISADVLTLISLFSGLVFCVLFSYSKLAAIVFLALHVVFDGLDGPLARYRNTASRKGSFTDTLADQIVVAATTITLIYHGIIHTLPGGIYIFAYTVVIAFSVVRNALAIPYSWLVRPRFVMYIWIIVELYLWPGTINYVLWIFVILLTIKMSTGFYKIRKRI